MDVFHLVLVPPSTPVYISPNGGWATHVSNSLAPGWPDTSASSMYPWLSPSLSVLHISSDGATKLQNDLGILISCIKRKPLTSGPHTNTDFYSSSSLNSSDCSFTKIRCGPVVLVIIKDFEHPFCTGVIFACINLPPNALHFHMLCRRKSLWQKHGENM